MIARLEKLVQPVRINLPRVFRLEDRVFGGLFDRDIETARRIAPIPIPLNAALTSRSEVEDSRRVLRGLRVRHLYDHPFKIWDGVRIFSTIIHETEPTAAVLDFGSGSHSNVLRWLELHGYSRLRAVDLVFKRPIRQGSIEYFGDDVMKTHFEEGSFDVAFAQSVIEHGIDPVRFFEEARRVLRPGGPLLISTDFWPAKVETRDQTMYGAPWTIFSEDELRRVVGTAAEVGFRLETPLKLQVGEPLLEVFGRRYTFAFFALRRGA